MCSFHSGCKAWGCFEAMLWRLGEKVVAPNPMSRCFLADPGRMGAPYQTLLGSDLSGRRTGVPLCTAVFRNSSLASAKRSQISPLRIRRNRCKANNSEFVTRAHRCKQSLLLCKPLLEIRRWALASADFGVRLVISICVPTHRRPMHLAQKRARRWWSRRPRSLLWASLAILY